MSRWITDFKPNIRKSIQFSATTSGKCRLLMQHKKWTTAILLGFEREINVITRGKKVGEGWMVIVTFFVNYVVK